MAGPGKEVSYLSQFFGPGALAGDYSKLYSLLLSSPGFQNVLSNMSIQGTNLSQNLTANLARRGLTGTGVGTVAQSLGQAVPGFMQQQAKAGLSQEALQAAMQNLLARMGIYGELRGQQMNQPGFLQSLFGGLMGGAGSLLPFLKGLGGPGKNPYDITKTYA